VHPLLRAVHFMHLAKQTKLILKYRAEMTKPLVSVNVIGYRLETAIVVAGGIKHSPCV